MAVVGSGPAGFYTAYKVMSKVDNSVVDMYEHLPVPFGLVRFGVAPDHPEVKVSSICRKEYKARAKPSVELPREIRGSCSISEVQFHRQYIHWGPRCSITSANSFTTLRCNSVCLWGISRPSAGHTRRR